MQMRTSLSRVRLQVTEDRRTAEAGIDLDKGLLDFGRCYRLRVRQLKEFGGNFHRGARLADGLEIRPRAQSGAGAVFFPLVENQARAPASDPASTS